MVTAYIGLGSNLGDRLRLLRKAVWDLSRVGALTGVSSLYETEPVGYREQPWFLNAVVVLETELSPHQLLRYMQELERAAGRQRSFPNAPRTLDLDLLLYDDLVLNEEELVLPHPRLHERAFVVVPLVEISAMIQHPVFRLPMRQLLEQLGEWSSSLRRVAGLDWIEEPEPDGVW